VTYDWASPEIGARVVEKLADAKRGDRFELLVDLLTNKHLLQMSDPLWEAWCDIQMMGGAHTGPGPLTFRIRRLGVGSLTGVGSGNVAPTHPSLSTLRQRADMDLGATIGGDGSGTVTFPRAVSTTLLRATAELPAATKLGGHRFRARACFSAADFVEANGICTNATVSPVHELVVLGKNPANGLQPIMRQLRPGAAWDISSGSPVPFVWLVPSIFFYECRAGQMVMERPSKSAPSTDFDEATLLSQWVVQYAVEIPSPNVKRK